MAAHSETLIPGLPVNDSSALRVLVLGGTGFIGRHAVAALRDAGATVAIGSRHPMRYAQRYPFAKLHCVRFERLLHADAWQALLNGVDVVINCVGILRQRPNESYANVHHLAPAALALACAREGVRLIHTSALSLHEDAKSEYLRELRAQYTAAPVLQIPLPNWMARLGAHVCDVLHFSPFSYGHWILLQRDNVPKPNRLPELLGRSPRPITDPYISSVPGR